MMPETASMRPGVRRLWYTALILISGIAWSLVFSLAKIAGESSHHALGLTFWQGIGGGLTLAAISALRGKRLPVDARSLGFYVICGIFGTALPTFLIFEVAPEIGAGLLAITMALVPLFTYAIAVAIGIDRRSALRIAGLGLGLVAVLMIMLPSARDGGGLVLFWLLVALAIPASYTTENLLLAVRGPRNADPFALVAVFQIAGSALLLPITLATGTFATMQGPWGDPEWAAFAMMFVNSLSYALFLYVLQRTGPVFASQATYITTIFGVVWGIVLFGETHSPWVWAALAILMSGIALVQEHRAKRA
jgi:drug/metabolite transporter (DMT)-like permease